MNQIALPLETSTSKDSGYLVAPCNQDQHNQLQDWASWPHGVAILVGPPRSGKTAMVQQFAGQSGGLITEDAEQIDDDTLFHLWNRAQMEKRPLLIASAVPVGQWNVKLPDLKSRLAASQLIEIGPPSDIMIKGLFHKYITERGSTISEDAAGYLVRRIERNYSDIEELAGIMDRLAIERKKSVTLAIAKDALVQFEQGDSGRADGGEN